MEIGGTIAPYIGLLLALVLGMLLGVERTFAGKTAGLRTYGLVAMGSALFIIVSKIVLIDFVGLTSFDPLRVAAGVISGIGFIGAGLILFKENKLSGLTTAAGLWVASGIGIACGFELYMLATFATFLTLFAFTALWFVEDKVRRLRRKSDFVNTHNGS